MQGQLKLGHCRRQFVSIQPTGNDQLITSALSQTGQELVEEARTRSLPASLPLTRTGVATVKTDYLLSLRRFLNTAASSIKSSITRPASPSIQVSSFYDPDGDMTSTYHTAYSSSF